MSAVLGPIFAYPLHPAPWADYGRARGSSIDYRVTNPFDGPDFLNGGIHRAVDVGNSRRGDPLYAPLHCSGVGVRHIDGALGVRMALSAHVTLEVWHLDRLEVPSSGAILRPGQVIGITGASGARLPTGQPMPAHTHIATKRDGIPFDPEPHLFGAPLSLEEEDVKIPAGLSHVAQGVVAAGNRLRRDPSTTVGSRVLDAAIFVQVYGYGVPGEQYVLGSQPGDRYAWVGAYGETYFVAEPLLTAVDLTDSGRAVIPPADCSAQERELAVLRTQVARARTSAQGAAQAATATVEALR